VQGDIFKSFSRGSVPTVTTAALGHFLLLATLVSAAVSLLISPRRPALGQWFLIGAATAAAVAVGLLARALVRLDFSLLYVAEAARRGASRPFRLAGLWAGMAGSLLLWTAMLAVVGAWGARRVSALPRGPRLAGGTQRVVAGIVFGLALTSRLAADPFATLTIPAIDGGGIVPILEHPAMLIHPPLLYLGLAMTVPLFAGTLSALWHGQADADWDRLARRFALMSWTVLIAAMALGAAWADDELGWGGFWAWDPVENGVLLPWLGLTVFLHARRHTRLPRLAACVPIAVFLTASLGALLSRSGAVSSVHAFAQATAVGRFLLALLLVTFGASALAIVRFRRQPTPPIEQPTRQDRFLAGQLIVVSTIAAVVLAGTLWPIVSGWMNGRKRAVSAVFFQRLTAPLAAILLVLMFVDAVFARLSGTRLRGRLAHLGLAVFLVGAAASSLGHRVSVTVRAGDMVSVGSSRLAVGSPSVTPGSGYQLITVPVDIVGSGRQLRPQLKVYEARGLLLAETDRSRSPFNDIQVAIRNANPDGFIQLSANQRPLLSLVWLGTILMFLGGLTALSSKPSPRRRPVGGSPL
jgi:cytochrome c-type biogenesis protein CcmF